MKLQNILDDVSTATASKYNRFQRLVKANRSQRKYRASYRFN